MEAKPASETPFFLIDGQSPEKEDTVILHRRAPLKFKRRWS